MGNGLVETYFVSDEPAKQAAFTHANDLRGWQLQIRCIEHLADAHRLVNLRTPNQPRLWVLPWHLGGMDCLNLLLTIKDETTLVYSDYPQFANSRATSHLYSGPNNAGIYDWTRRIDEVLRNPRPFSALAAYRATSALPAPQSVLDALTPEDFYTLSLLVEQDREQTGRVLAVGAEAVKKRISKIKEKLEKHGVSIKTTAALFAWFGANAAAIESHGMARAQATSVVGPMRMGQAAVDRARMRREEAGTQYRAG